MYRCGSSLLLLALLQAAGLSGASGLKLELVSVLFRHGQRTPVAAYPSDSYQESHWPQGFGQLTTTGMQQQYFLGGVLRNRYVNTYNLIYPNYTRVQVYMRSTDYDRTLMSAESQLAAMFPPEGAQVFNTSIPWQPVPVHTVPKEDDNLLRAYASDCPRYQELREADKRSTAYTEKEEENKDFFNRLSQNTGKEVNLSNVWTLQDTLFVQRESGLPDPPWLSEEDLAKLTELATFTLSLMFNTKEKYRLTAGNWLSKVLNDMKAEKAEPQQDMKLYLYSAHDTTVACMTSALGVYDGILPPYAATFLIELYSDDNGNYVVSLFYRNDTNSSTVLPLSVASCRNPNQCTLDEFANLANPIIPNNWESECGLSSGGGGSQDEENISAIVLGVLFALMVLLLAVFVCAFIVLFCHHRQVRFKHSIMSEVEGSL